MSNTETVQKLYAPFSSGDLPEILAKLADDVVWESEGPEIISFSGIRRGIQETSSFFAGLAADHSDPQLTITDYVSEGDLVMTLGRYKATMKATGKAFDSPIDHYCKFRNGKVAHYVGLANTAAAVDALQPAVSSGPDVNLPSAITVLCTPKSFSAQQYNEVHRRLEALGEEAPTGRAFHTCFGTGDSLRVMDVWASMERFQQFVGILKPILDSLGIELGPSDIDAQPQHCTIFGN